jgi:hypothetical protein
MVTFRSGAILADDPALMRPPPVLVPPVGVEGRTTLLTLGPKGGKSTTVAGMLRDGSRRGIPVGLITLDEALPDSLQRLARFGADLPQCYFDDTFDPDNLTRQIQTLGIRFLAIDHLGVLAEQHPDFGAGSQGDSVLWGRLVSPFATLARDLNVAVVLLDQARRSDGKWSGSVGKGGAVDIIAELEPHEGGLIATPKGRVVLPPFRVDLDADGAPIFSAHGPGEPRPSSTEASGALHENARKMLELLGEAEPEGFTSSGWRKVAELSPTTYHRARRLLLRQGLALDPSQTRSTRYRITEVGERALLNGAVP